MNKAVTVSLISLALATGSAFAADAPVSGVENAGGYYGAARLVEMLQSVKSTELTSPRVTGMVRGPDTKDRLNGSLALGYDFGNGWRTEGEYTLPRDAGFDSYWAPFTANANHFQVRSQRLMFNGYRDYNVGRGFSLYGMAGLGVAFVSADGWQGNPNRSFAKNSQNNFSYSFGAGVNYKVTKRVTVEAGYRFVDMGNVQTSYNNFRMGAIGVLPRDEQLKARLMSNEFFLGARSTF
ncbi:outer membrane beta-barrel protein [Trinickia sp. YCB016]